MYFYLHFPESPENIISTQQQYRDYLREVQNCIDRCDCEKHAMLIADEVNVQTFQENLIHLGEIIEYIGAYQINELFYLVLEQSSIEYWNGSPLHDIDENTKFYRLFSSSNRSFIEQYPASFKELAERCGLNVATYSRSHILLDFSRDETYSPFISFVTGGLGEKPMLFNITSVNNFLSLDKWIIENIPQRRYNNRDNRHCENHNDFRPDKSPLIGGVGGKVHAAKLLKTAIGDRRRREYLINWDSENNRFIRFEFENDSQNQYHGYHLVLRGSYQEDIGAVEAIPERILSLIRYRRELEE